MKALLKSPFFPPALLSLLAFLVFFPSLFCELTNWDTGDLITDNLLIRSLSIENLQKMFGSFYWYNYQPLTLLSFAVEYHFFRINPMALHLDNIILHSLNTFILYWLIFRLTGSVRVSSITCLLWAIHPLRVESVTWVVERKDVLYGLFYLLSLNQYLLYLKSSPSNNRNIIASMRQIIYGQEKMKALKPSFHYSFSVVFFVLSCFAKGMAVSLPLVLLVIDFFVSRKRTRSFFLDKLPFFLIAFIFGMFVLYALKEDPFQPIVNITLWQERIIYASYGLLFYITRFLFPLNLSAFYPYPYPNGEVPLYCYIYPCIVLLFVISVFISLRLTTKIVFGTGFFLATVLFVLQLKQTNSALVADHYSYIPHIGLSLIAGWFFNWLLGRSEKNIFRVCVFLSFILFILSLIYLSIRRTDVWKNSITLWTDAVKKYPNSLSYDNLGSAYLEKNKYSVAMKMYNHALRVNTKNKYAYNNRGKLRMMLNDLTGASSDYKKAIEIAPRFTPAYVNLSALMLSLKKYDSTLIMINKSLELMPGNTYAIYNRGCLWGELKQYDKALADYNYLISTNQYSPEYYNKRGLVFIMLKNYEKAIFDYNNALSLDSTIAEAFFNRGSAKWTLNDTLGACDDWHHALQSGFLNAALKLQTYCLKFASQYPELQNKKPVHARQVRYPDGKIKLEVKEEMVNDRIVFRLKLYDKDGNVSEEGIVDSTGKYNGEIKWYYPSHALKIIGFYYDTIPYGMWKEYYEYGKLKEEYSYADGKRSGSCRYYHSNGKLWTERVYNNGKIWEVLVNIDSTGKSLDPGTLKHGNGLLNIYDESGKLISTEKYRDGNMIREIP